MRWLVLSLALALCWAATACGGGKCAGPVSGDWVGTTVDDTLGLEATCAFAYTGPGGCTSAGTYVGPLEYRSPANRGTLTATVSATTGTADGLCLPVGEHSCSYAASETTLSISCGAGSFNYRR